ncbi:DUF742 domain-containing protein [Spirillospora sp. NPDC047279]|uniref:DUF742 domain-containing protein n=1 Tax=Spirillospora sp. NPDC047279 TaxID=3155478 RepID=UPI0033DA2959
MPEPFLDEDPGPIVRPYTLTGGRTRSDAEDAFDLVSLIETTDDPVLPTMDLGPEHLRIRQICARSLSVAEVAADLDLPVDVVRVLLGDLLGHHLIRSRRPAAGSQLPDDRLLKEVIDGLNEL